MLIAGTRLGPYEIRGPIGRVLLSADASTYVYQFSRGLNELFLAQGLR